MAEQHQGAVSGVRWSAAQTACGDAFRGVVGLLAAGVLARLPVKTFDARCAPAAYRFVESQARRLGKVVLTIPDGQVGSPGWRGHRGEVTGGTGMATVATHIWSS